MESQVWVKVSLFLKELRCEDIKRNSIIHLESCQKEKKALKIFRQVWEKGQKNLSELQQRAICNYIEQMQAVSFEIPGGGFGNDKLAFVLLPVGSPGFLRFLRPQSVTGWLGLDVG